MKWNRTPTKEKASGPSPQVKPQRQLDHEEWLWNTRVWSNMAVEPGQNCSPLTMHLAHNVCQGIPRYTNGWILPHFQTCPNWSMTTTWTHIYAVLTQASRTIQDWWNSVFKHLPKLQLEKPPKKNCHVRFCICRSLLSTTTVLHYSSTNGMNFHIQGQWYPASRGLSWRCVHLRGRPMIPKRGTRW